MRAAVMMTMSMGGRSRFSFGGLSFGLEVRFDLGFDSLFGGTLTREDRIGKAREQGRLWLIDQ
jgi:hypothetical protein